MRTLREVTRTARKHHQCDLCGGPIMPGEQYRRATNIDDTIFDWLECDHCIKDNVPIYVGNWTYGDYYTLEAAQEWATEAVIHGHPKEQAAAKNYLERGNNA